MSGVILNFWLSFLAGLFAPLGAVCVLPLYPAFLSYLSSQLPTQEDGKQIIKLGWMVTFGVITSMFIAGLIFSFILESSLTNAIGIISPIAFGILAIISLFLIFNFDFSKLFPKYNAPILKTPSLTSFIFGLFFGAIVLPCNPASLALLFAISLSTIDFLVNFLNFIFFGIGMATPLLLFAYISSTKVETVITFLSNNKRIINLIAGIIMLVISLYYLIFVFQIFGVITNSYQAISLDTDKMVQEENMKYIVEPSKIISGGPPKDGIPSIDNPKFVSLTKADEWIEDNELVLALTYKETKRVYPLQIMVFHEIVNDKIDDEPILITYCPLCGSGIAYERKIDGEEVEFGTSGKLYNSNLVMYDRKTESYWTQIDGLAIVGPLTGTELIPISIDTVVWRDWKNAHPESEVLSQDTGYKRNYGDDPYGNYYEDSFVWFPLENEDKRIHAKTVVFGIEVNGKYKAYKEEDLIEKKEIEDKIDGVEILIKRSNDGVVKVTNKDTKEEIVKERDFWFAWYAFHPDTEVYE